MLLAYNIVYHFFKGNWEIFLKCYNYLKLISALPRYEQNISVKDKEGRSKEKLEGNKTFLRFISNVKVGEHGFIFSNTVKQCF